jgi:hypothetical protein
MENRITDDVKIAAEKRTEELAQLLEKLNSLSNVDSLVNARGVASALFETVYILKQTNEDLKQMNAELRRWTSI